MGSMPQIVLGLQMPVSCPKCDRGFPGKSLGHHAPKCGLTVVDLFWTKVEKTDSCWIWTGSRKPKGYGHLRHANKDYNAHRLSYELANGPIPALMEVMHTCDVPYCVNPAHLKLGSHAENMADCRDKRRHSYGERNHHAKLTEDDVRAIRRDYRRTSPRRTNASELAERYGVASSRISAIINGHQWSHIE